MDTLVVLALALAWLCVLAALGRALPRRPPRELREARRFLARGFTSTPATCPPRHRRSCEVLGLSEPAPSCRVLPSSSEPPP